MQWFLGAARPFLGHFCGSLQWTGLFRLLSDGREIEVALLLCTPLCKPEEGPLPEDETLKGKLA